MESVDNGSRGDEMAAATKTRKRSRRSKLKSNVSVRLNPDFDPKHSVFQNICVSSNVNDKADDELDPKTMDFDTLAEFLHPTFIYDYLQKTLCYLKSSQSELCFPNLAPYKEAFLVKISKDYRHLMSRTFNEASANIGRQIIDVLCKNKDVYKWMHCYMSGTDGKCVLTYKKIECKDDRNEQHRTPHSFTSQVSLASSHEDMSDHEKQTIPTSFRISMLNKTLKFMKDVTQSILEYPVMTMNQAKFIYSLIYEDNKEGDIGLGFKSLHAPLVELMSKIGEYYEFVVTFVDTGDDTTKLILQKIPRNISKTVENSPNGNSSNISTVDKLSKSQKVTVNKQKLIQGLSESFIHRSLKELFGYIDDKYRASIEFKDIDEAETRFLEGVTSISRNLEQYTMLGEESVVFLKRIARCCRREPWRLKLSIGRLCKKTGRRNVTFTKEPTYETDSMDITRSDPVKSQPMDISQSDPQKSLQTKPVSNVQTIEMTRNFNRISSSDDRVVKQRSVSLERKSRQIQGAIAFQSAGAHHIENRIDNSSSMDSKQTIDNVDKGNDIKEARKWGSRGRKDKLLEAMSTPMESVIAEKMMRRMGWDGGGLGLRGEGIKEPIIPALHLSPGAGFGHIKQVKQSNQSVCEFREKFLTALLSFLQTDDANTSISFAKPLTKREGRFIKPAISTINARKQLGLSRTEESDLIKNIVDIMCNNHLHIDFEIRDGKKALYLSKKQGAVITPKVSKNRKNKSKLDPDNSATALPIPNTNNTEIITPGQTISLNNACRMTKAEKSLVYRILFLEKIKEFVKMENNVAEFKFDCVLNKRRRNFVSDVITDVNKKVSKCKYSEVENDIYREIRKAAGDCFMSVIFCGQKFILEKKYYQRRFTNSALGLPPIKSKDVKNTIIYTKDGVICDGNRDKNLMCNDQVAMVQSNGIINDDNHGKNDICNNEDAMIHNGVINNENVNENVIFNEQESMIHNCVVNYGDHDKKVICNDQEDINNCIINDDSQENVICKDPANIHDGVINDNRDENGISNDQDVMIHSGVNNDTNPDETDNGEDNKLNNLDSEDDVIIISEKYELIVISDDEMNATLSIDRDSDEKVQSNEDDPMETDLNETKDISLDISNESLLLGLLEQENNSCVASVESNTVKKELVDDFESVLKEFTENYIDNDIIAKTEVNNNYSEKHDSNESIVNTNKENENNTSLDIKKSFSESVNSETKNENSNVDLRFVSIVSKNYDKISLDLVKEVQKLISDKIDDNIFLPLLKCHGVHNGELVYSCLNEKSFDWLKSTLSVASVEIIPTDFGNCALIMKIGSFIPVELKTVLNRLKMYNSCLDTKHWKFTNEKVFEDSVSYNVSLDENSFKYISMNNFTLFAGVDKVEFSIIWD